MTSSFPVFKPESRNGASKVKREICLCRKYAKTLRQQCLLKRALYYMSVRALIYRLTKTQNYFQNIKTQDVSLLSLLFLLILYPGIFIGIG